MRIEGKGQIDRNAPLTFKFDGRSYGGFKGDTLASALLANGVKLVGRSFKYHRPRGVLTAGSEEPSALVEIIGAANQTPNVRATVQEVFEGLTARSQNRWPSLRFDALAINDLAAPFLSAGFYYKTFMWPRAFWEGLYEPLIRRAAGLGSLSGKHDEGNYEKAFAFCDLLVVGAGPAGLMAALTGPEWVAQVVAELKSLPNVRIMTRTTVTGAYDGGTFAALERVGLHKSGRADLPRECFWRIVAGRTVLAAGAIERPIAFPMNDRPGIMMAGAVRSYLNRYGVVPGRKVTVFANNDSARATARALMAAGVQVAAIIDSRPEASAVEDCPVYLGGQITDTKG